MLLENVKGIHQDTELTTEYNALAEHMNLMLDQMNTILEAHGTRLNNRVPPGAMGGGGAVARSGEEAYWANRKGQDNIPTGARGTHQEVPEPGQVDVTGGGMDEIISGMEQVSKQMDAAKRGLGIVNKLGDSPSRTTNRSRVMGNMNRIRANLRRIEKQLTGLMSDDTAEPVEARNAMERGMSNA